MRQRPMLGLRMFALTECESEAALYAVGRCGFLVKPKLGAAEGIMVYAVAMTSKTRVAASAGKRLHACFTCQGRNADVG